MTRFEQEIKGLLGERWQKSAEADMQMKVEYAHKNATVDENGVIRWKINNSCLMDDYCEILEYANYNFNREATNQARDIQVAKEIREYRESQNNYKYSNEELAEMRNAFGAGETIVNVLTGEEIVL